MGKPEWFCGIINLRRITIVAKSVLFSVLRMSSIPPPPPHLTRHTAMIATSNPFFLNLSSLCVTGSGFTYVGKILSGGEVQKSLVFSTYYSQDNGLRESYGSVIP